MAERDTVSPRPGQEHAATAVRGEAAALAALQHLSAWRAAPGRGTVDGAVSGQSDAATASTKSTASTTSTVSRAATAFNSKY